MIDNQDITLFVTESFNNEDELTEDMIIEAYVIILTYIATALEEVLNEGNKVKVKKLLETKLINFSHGV